MTDPVAPSTSSETTRDARAPETGRAQASAPVVELVGIDKCFGATRANRDVHLSLSAGTIHGLVGENGAGKSTLMSILHGETRPDRGEIRLDGRRVDFRSPADAIRAGIGMVHQQFMLVDTMTVLENVLLGATRATFLGRPEKAARAALAQLAADYDLAIDPDAVVASLSVGEQQRVEILKILLTGAEILILDEPTAVLTPAEADHLFEILRRLRDEGRTIVVISHRLAEITALTDRVSVMRAGEIVAEHATADIDVGVLAEAMIGHRLPGERARLPSVPGAVALSVEGVSLERRGCVPLLDRVSLEVRAGEIVGIAGVAGNGQSELIDCVTGIRAPTRGTIRIAGQATTDLDPAEIRALGLAHVPEDRTRRGLVMEFSAEENGLLGSLDDPAWGRGLLIDRGAMRRAAREAFAAFDIRPADPTLAAATFSGGNQQKIVVAREVARAPRVLVVGQPTRGLDIGAIDAIRRRIVDLRDEGVAVLLVSSDLDEIRALADRVLVMCRGRIVGECRADVDDATIGAMMAGVTGAEGMR